MEIVTSTSASRQPDRVDGPTVILLNTGESVTETDEGKTYTYKQYIFAIGEMELIRAGILPAGAEWDAELRSIERGALYEAAERKIAKYRDDVEDPERLEAWVAYKAAVRGTVGQAGYPERVDYPEPPE